MSRILIFSLLTAGWQTACAFPSISSYFASISDSTLVVSSEFEEERLRYFSVPEYREDSYEAFKNGYTHLTDSNRSLIQKAQLVLQTIEKTSNFVRNLNDKSVISLPVGIKKTINGIDYTIGISEITITPYSSSMEAFLQIDIPQSETVLTFHGKGIPFSSTGGIPPGSYLSLIEDFNIPLPGNKLQVILYGGAENTRALFGCDGFEMLEIAGAVEFSREVVKPITKNGNIKSGNVLIEISSAISDWNNLYISVESPPFEITKGGGIQVMGTQAVFDFSDFRSPDQNIKLPEWRGLYLKECSVQLPTYIKDRHSQSLAISANNLWLSKGGVDFQISVDEILSIEDGKLGSFEFSIDHFETEILNNRVNNLTFSGLLRVPYGHENSIIQYSAYQSEDTGLLFEISQKDSLSLSFLGNTTIQLYDQTTLLLEKSESQWNPKLILSGETMARVPIRGKQVDLGKIKFYGLTLAGTQEPIQWDKIQFEQEGHFDQFPLTLNSIEIQNQNSSLQTEIQAEISLGNSHKLRGLTSLIIHSQKNGKGWSVSDIRLSEVQLHAKVSAFKFDGTLLYTMSENKESEFRGSIMAEVEPGFSFKCSAIFGKKESFKYWYFDVLTEIPQGIPIIGNLAAYGIGGGGYNKMSLSASSKDKILPYVPDRQAGMGFKAAVILGSYPNRETFTSELIMEIGFLSNGALSHISFTGTAEFAVKPENLTSKIQKLTTQLNSFENSLQTDAFLSQNESKGQISARLQLVYNHTLKVFSGNFQVYVDMADSRLTGVGENGLAGWGNLYFGPDTWYIHIGKPTNRIGLSLNTDVIEAQLTAYLVAGESIPAIPPPPEQVRNLLNTENYQPAEANQVRSGFLFGANFNMETGERNFLMFYGSFSAGIGFDLSFYKTVVSFCNNDINSWNAAGQAYGYFDGIIGIRVKVGGVNQRFDILRISAAALIEASLPSPIFFKATVGGKFEILGGLITGTCNFQVRLGETCEESQSNDLTLSLIGGIKPSESQSNVEVTCIPSASFNIPIGIPQNTFIKGESVSLRAQLNEFSVISGTTPISGVLKWSEDQTTAYFLPDNILNEHTSYRIIIHVEIQEKKGSYWQAINQSEEDNVKNLTFTTGEKPTVISSSNIAYSYPALKQQSFYTAQSQTGYIQLKQGLPELFYERPLEQIQVVFQSADQLIESSWEYKSDESRITFQIPQNLNPETEYHLKIIRKTNTEGSSTSDDSSEAKPYGEINIRENEIQEYGAKNDVILYENSFSTSRFQTFEEEFSNLSHTNSELFLVSTGIHEIKHRFTGKLYTAQPEISLPYVNVLSGNRSIWFTEEILPKIYEKNPMLYSAINWRSVSYNSFIPKKTVDIINSQDQTIFSDNIARFVFKDLQDIKSHLAALLLQGKLVDRSLLEMDFPSLKPNQDHGIDLLYILPGGIKSGNPVQLDFSIR